MLACVCGKSANLTNYSKSDSLAWERNSPSINNRNQTNDVDLLCLSWKSWARTSRIQRSDIKLGVSLITFRECDQDMRQFYHRIEHNACARRRVFFVFRRCSSSVFRSIKNNHKNINKNKRRRSLSSKLVWTLTRRSPNMGPVSFLRQITSTWEPGN